MEQLKRCTECKESKPLEAFSIHRKLKDGRNTKCKKCKNKQGSEYYARNKERILARQSWNGSRRERWLREQYGLSLAEYDELLTVQGGTCAICGDPPGEVRLHVDHCHVSGQVRGLLCYSCNGGLGSFKDSETRLLAAVKYLNNPTRPLPTPGGSL